MACSVTLGTPLRVEGPRTKAEGWGTDLVPVPQPFGEQARMLGGGTRPRGPTLPRPRRKRCNRTRSRGTPDCRSPHGRTASVHRSRRTPWLNPPVSRVEGARRSVSLSVSRCFDILARRRGEKRTRAIAEQARSGMGVDGLRVLAPGAGVGRTHAGVDPADR